MRYTIIFKVWQYSDTKITGMYKKWKQLLDHNLSRGIFILKCPKSGNKMIDNYFTLRVIQSVFYEHYNKKLH